MPPIRVGIRLKPEENKNLLRGFTVKRNQENCEIDIIVSETKYEFSFDEIFEQNSSQRDIFIATAQPIINEVINGFDGTIFAYGQTGAGKTYTITGSQNEIGDDFGLCRRSVCYLFDCLKKLDGFAYSVQFSALEIYNDNMFDLLRDQLKSDSIMKLFLVETASGVQIPSLYLIPVASAEEATSLLFDANLNRVVSEHQLNRRSSRSHCIFTFHITKSKYGETIGQGAADVTLSKLHLVDLAGSERIEKTGVSGKMQKEAGHINRSLLFLEQVVIALTKPKNDNSYHVPYRQSKLTFLLKHSLGGNCNTYLIACIWPHESYAWETLSTLRFAARMRNIVNSEPIRCGQDYLTVTDTTVYRQLKNELNELRQELSLRDSLSGHISCEPWIHDLSKGQRLKTLKTIGKYTLNEYDHSKSEKDQYLNNSREKFPLLNGISSVSHIYLLSSIFRSMLWDACAQDKDKVKALVEKHCGYESPAAAAATPVDDSMTQTQQGQDQEHVEAVYDTATSAATATAISSEPSSYPNINAVVDQKDDILAYSDNNNNNKTNTTATEVNVQESFELFKAGEGSVLHADYEQKKQQLKDLKSNQRQLASELNRIKTLINETTEKINEEQMNSSQVTNGATMSESSPLLSQMKTDLDTLKKQYKSNYALLQQCKENISILEIDKRNSLSNLMSAFQRLSITTTL